MAPTDNIGPHEAAGSGKVDILMALAKEHGAKALVERNENGHSPAFLAAAGGHGKCLRVIYETCGPTAVRNLADGGLSAAHLAALRGHVDCLTDLADLDKAILGEASANGCTPCYFACVAGRGSSVQRLYNLGERSSLFARDKAGKAPLDAAREAGKAEVVELLKQLREQCGDSHSPIASSVKITDDEAAGVGGGVFLRSSSVSSQGERTPEKKKFMGAAASFLRKSMTKETGMNPSAFSPPGSKEREDKVGTSFSSRGSQRV